MQILRTLPALVGEPPRVALGHDGVLGMTLNVDEGRITIFRSTLETLGWPSHYRFLYNPQMNQIAVQVYVPAGLVRVGVQLGE